MIWEIDENPLAKLIKLSYQSIELNNKITFIKKIGIFIKINSIIFFRGEKTWKNVINAMVH